MITKRLRAWASVPPTDQQRLRAKQVGKIFNLAWFAGSLYVAWIAAPSAGDFCVVALRWVVTNIETIYWWIGAVSGFAVVTYSIEHAKVLMRDWLLHLIRDRQR